MAAKLAYNLEIAMWKQLTLGSALVLFASGVSMPGVGSAAQEPAAADWKVPPEVAKQVNPVKPTAASQARVKKLYGFDCAMCHGTSGDGKGDLAADMKLSLKDWRDPGSLKDMTDGELNYIISKGKGKMPAGADQMKPDEIWNMVSYVRAFAGKSASAKAKEE
jgi:mono/diheme cytochrome c family protein